jgi:hypothetical protein
MVTVASIISKLTSLNKKELATVKAAIDQLLGPQAALAASPSNLSLFEAIRVATGAMVTYDRLKGGNTGASWRKYSPLAVSFIETTWPCTKQNKMVRLGLERLLISLLVEDLREKRVNVTVGALVRNLGRLPEVVDAEFPGYRESQLQSLIIKAMEKNHD